MTEESPKGESQDETSNRIFSLRGPVIFSLTNLQI